MSALFRDPRLEHDLEQHVAELVANAYGIAFRHGVRELVRLFERVRHDRRPGLFAIPRAAAFRVAEPGHDREQALDLHAQGLSSRRPRLTSMPAVAPQMLRSPNGMSYASNVTPANVRARGR